VWGSEKAIALVRDVVSRRAAHGEEAPGPEVEIQTARETLDALSGLHLLGLLRGEESVSAVVRAVRGPEQPTREDPEAVVIVLGQRQIARDVGRGDRDIQQPADLVAHV